MTGIASGRPRTIRNKFYLVAGVALVYVDYFLRAVRWKILLRPVCEARSADLVAPTMIGFTGLALLGRPGEFIRPYLIARKAEFEHVIATGGVDGGTHL